MLGEGEHGMEMLQHVATELVGGGAASGDFGEEPIVGEAGPIADDIEEILFDNGGDFVLEDGLEFEVGERGLGDGAGDVGIVEADVGVEEKSGEGEPKGLAEGDVHAKILPICSARRR